VIKGECPRCRQSIEVPDHWAGRQVRCQGCDRIFRLAAPETTGESLTLPDTLDDLANLEQAHPDKHQFELVDFEGSPSTSTTAVPPAEEPAAVAARGMRVCPHCGKPVRASDEYSEVICSHCQEPVPGVTATSDAYATKDRRYAGRLSQRIGPPGGFYDGFLGAFVYPISALASIITGMGVAAIVIILPVGMLLAFALGTGLNPLAGDTDVSWLEPLLFAMFLAETVYFGGVGYFLLVDTLRNTALGVEKPPGLTWNLTSVGTALVGYTGLVLYYLAIGLVLILVKNAGELRLPTRSEDVQGYFTPGFLFVFAVVTFTIPMNVIGLASGRLIEAFDPRRIARSIARTAVHYFFLFLIVCLYLGVYGGVMGGAVGLASTAVIDAIGAYAEGGSQEFGDVLLGLASFVLLIGVGIYFAYVMGRLLGLFAKSYRDRLAFDI